MTENIPNVSQDPTELSNLIPTASQDTTELCRLISCIPTLESIVIKKEPFKVGRSTRCDFVFEEKNVEQNFISCVSRLHFEITKDPGNSVLYITDLSKNSTFLNGIRLKKSEKKDLKDGDIIALGMKNYNVFTFRSTEDLPDTATPMKLSDSQTPTGSTEVIPWGHLTPCVLNLESFDLRNNEFKVGRSQKCDLIIERMKINQNIKDIFSKEHFIIFKDPDSGLPFIRDLSRAGTNLNGRPIGRNNTNVLQTDDVISIGRNKLKLFVYKCMDSKDTNYLPAELKQKYVPSKLLGRGAAGEVRLALEKFTCKMVAIKKIPESRSTLSQIQKLSHPCVINIKDIAVTAEEVYIVLDYMKGGNLTNRISNTPLSESNVKFLFLQMVLAVQFLHDKGIMHRDLKPENFLLLSDDIETVVKVSDFGQTKVTEGDDMTTICGNMNYLAPEVLDKNIPEYNKQVDVWSLGVILFYMLSKRLPFQSSNKKDLEILILTGYYKMAENYWDGVSASAKDLVKKMLNVDPHKRSSIQDILKHQWLGKDIVMKHKLHSLLKNHLDLQNSSEDIVITYGMEPPPKRLKLSFDDTAE